MRITGLNDAAIQIFEDNSARGFHNEPIETGTCLMMVVSELSEALEADRIGKRAQSDQFKIDATKSGFEDSESEAQYKKQIFEWYIKNSFEDEIADAIIRLLDISALQGIDIEWHIEQKLAYNRTREYKHGKAY